MSAATSLPEALRNRVLRRVDWRFLLPDPAPSRSLCLAGGLLRDGVAAISSGLAPSHAPPAGDCELAVAVDPDTAALRRILETLRPGGACYTEWYRPGLNARVVRARLAAAGFAETRCYWPWPLPGRGITQFWLPLDDPQAVDYFLASRPHAHGAARRLGRALLWAAWRRTVGRGLALPVCAVARRSPAGSGIDPYDGADAGTQILLTGGARSINKVVALRFDEGGHTPRMAVKHPRIPEALPALAREAQILRQIEALRPGGVPGAPRVLDYHPETGRLCETVLQGTPLWVALRRENFRSLALLATDWLTHLAGRPAPRPRAEWWGRLVEPALAEFSEQFGAVVAPAMVRAARERLATLEHLPLVCEQRDFSPWNLLLDANRALVVLDWESAELRGLPALDLTYFLTYLGFFLEGTMKTRRFREDYRAMLGQASFVGAVWSECMARYGKAVGLDTAALQPLRLLTWLIHARSEYRQREADAGGPPTPTALSNSMFVQLLEEELRNCAAT